MQRDEILENVEYMLKKEGYEIIHLNSAACDMIAQKEHMLVLKVLENVDSLNKVCANDLNQLSDFFNATPLLIGDHTSSEVLQTQLIYFRRGIWGMHPLTLDLALRGEEFFVFQNNGQHFVKIDPYKFVQSIEERNLSKRDVARKIGLSVKAISAYERGGYATLATCAKLEEILEDISQDFSLLEWKLDKISYKRTSSISQKLSELNLFSMDFDKLPFTTVALDYNTNEKFIVRKEKVPRSSLIELMAQTKRLSHCYPFFVLSRERSIGVPYVTEKEFERFKDKDTLKSHIF